MANKVASIVRLCKTERGWRRYPVVFGKNGKIKPGIVMVDGVEREYKQGRYQVRRYQGSKLIYKNAGIRPSEATALREITAAKLGLKKDGADVGVDVDVDLEEDSSRKTVAVELKRFIEAAKDRGSEVAADVYRLAGDEFVSVIRKTYLDEITAGDILKFQRALRKRGCSDRTIANRHASIISFLRWCGLDVKTLAPRKPKYEKTLPETYTSEELTALFQAIEQMSTSV